MISLIFTLLSQTSTWAFSDTEPQVSTEQEKQLNYKTFILKTQVESTYYQATIYQPTQVKIKSVLVISPTINGVSAIEESNAQYFSKRGYVVIVPELFNTELNSPKPDTEKLNSDFYKPAISAITFINLVDQKLNLPDTLPIFALGASMGGISSLIIAANIPRIKAAWIAVAGGDLPYIYAHSEVKQLDKFRKNHMKILGMTNMKVYENYLRMYLKNDPTVSCKDISIPFHQTIALRDTSVHTKTQELLVNECPAHNVSRKNLNHSAGSMTTVLERQKIMEYFDSFI